MKTILEKTRQYLTTHPEAQQIIAVQTTQGNLHFVVSYDVISGDYREENALFEKLQAENDTNVSCFITMWNNGCLDMCSRNFRTKLLQLNPSNLNAQTLLQGPGVYHAKTLKQLLPPEK